ncbi:MAG: EutN/CcmL family microcompartment protein [Synergistaceae bacterium]|jgi:ethanolamine utilization protein EutN|nr:EutN/CcmL family microcompartment protein [Synergistaceae bacterium]
MKLGKVVGSVVATRKHELLVGYKLLIVRQLKPGPDGSLIPAPGSSEFTVAVDLAGAGVGEIVLFTTGSPARNSASDSSESPVDEAIVGIVDSTDVNGNEVC